MATERGTFGMNRNASVNGDAVSWSFFVKDPAYTSKRCDPELVIIRLGIDVRVLLIARTVGVA